MKELEKSVGTCQWARDTFKACTELATHQCEWSLIERHRQLCLKHATRLQQAYDRASDR